LTFPYDCACNLPVLQFALTTNQEDGDMAKRSKRKRARGGLPTPIWVGGLVGLVLIAVGLIVLTEQQSTNPNALPYPDVPRVSAAEAHNQQQTGSGIIYDVREIPFYEDSRAAGALPLPEDEVLTRLDELPTDKSLIFY
jgi:hypothetical protein